MKTHKVLDLHYHPGEGQECFDGTFDECSEFLKTQSPIFMYEIVPMSVEEINNHPDNKHECKNFRVSGNVFICKECGKRAKNITV